MSIGGVLGGVFNTLVAPALFKTVIEYPLVMIVACALCPRICRTSRPVRRWGTVAWSLGIELCTLALIFLVSNLGLTSNRFSTLIIFGVPALLAYSQVQQSLRFSFILSAILLASSFYTGLHGRTLLEDRNFFGVLRVTMDTEGKYCQMIHGNTLHGGQSVDRSRVCEPLSYYLHTGPIGQVFNSVSAATNSSSKVAVIGLGVGSLACYAKPVQEWVFYEINPAVVEIGQDRDYFTFMQHDTTNPFDVVLGDPRLRLKTAVDSKYNLIVIDAFSSDSIPVHLITQEALALYKSKLSEDGVLAFLLTNRRLDLKPVIANLAADANLFCLNRDDNDINDAERQTGKDYSQWIVMTRGKESVFSLQSDKRWQIRSGRATTDIIDRRFL